MRFIGLFIAGLVWAGGLWGESPLYWAIANNDAWEVWRLTAPEGPPAVLEENGLAPPAWAMERGSAEVIEVLAWRGVALDQVDGHGRNLLFGAAALGRSDLFDRIVAAGASVNQTDDQGMTLVHAAATSQRPDLLKGLLAMSLSATTRSTLGVTPLMLACGAGRADEARLLVRWGAVPEDEDYLGRSVRDYATASEDGETVSVVDAALAPWPLIPWKTGPDDGAPLP